MGGSPTNYTNVSDNPATMTPEQRAKLEASYARIEKQGMSDDIDTEIIGAMHDIGHMAKQKLMQIPKEIPNFFGRDASKPVGQDK